MTDEKKSKGKSKKPDGRSSEAREAALARTDDIQDMYLSPNRQCSALSQIHQRRCRNRAMVGQRTCRMHGGATKRARTKAAERIQQASGYAADLLVEFMADPETDKTLRTKIAQDLMDRAGVSAKTILQIGVEQPKSFEDWVGEAVVDMEVVPDETVAAYNPPPTRDLEVLDAEVVEDEDDEPPVQNKRDRAAFHESSRQPDPRRKTRRQQELEAEEAAIFAEQAKREGHNRTNKRREAFLRALDAGATHEQAEKAGQMAADGIKPDLNRPRRARQSTADWV